MHYHYPLIPSLLTIFHGVNALALPLGELSTTPQNYTAPTPNDALPVTGQTNLYWVYDFLRPLISLDTTVVDNTLEDFRKNMAIHVPGFGMLNRQRYGRTRGQVQIMIRPTDVGPEPDKRHDSTWFITNDVAAEMIQDLQLLIERQHSPIINSLIFYVFEKDTPERQSRGTVAFGRLTTDPPPPMLDLSDLSNVIEMPAGTNQSWLDIH